MSYKIYTKTGDKGQTALFGGARVPKDHFRIEAYGTIDELNSFLGALIDILPPEISEKYLDSIQSELFVIGSHLATDPSKKNLKLPAFSENATQRLESHIDNMDSNLPALKNFVLPGGHLASSYAHICRTVCRRAERRVISLGHQEEVADWIVIYLNRLSDFFFMLSRYVVNYFKVKEKPWLPDYK